MKKVITIEASKPVDDKGEIRTKLRVAAYCRVSTSTLEQLNSYRAQKDFYENMIRSNPEWEFVDVYADEGITGTSTKKRNDFQRLMSDCERMEIDLVITKSISRFARNTTDCIRAVRKLKSLGIAVEFEKEKINTLSAESELILTILSSIAEEESKSISQNIKWANQKRAMEGKPAIFCNKLYGYKRDYRNGIEIIPEEAEIVRYIFNSYVNGKSHGTIAKELMESGVKTANGRSKWAISTVKLIITNEKYVGDMLVGKQYVTEDGTYKRKRNYGQAPQYYITDHHPAIVSRDLFEKAQAVIAQRRKQFGIDMNNLDKYNNRYIFSHRAFCGECGCRLTRVIIGNNRYKRCVTWRCAHYKDYMECSTTSGIVEEKIFAGFIKLFNTLYCNYEEVLIPFLKDTRKLLSLTHKNAAIEALEKRIHELMEEERLLFQLEVQGIIGHDMVKEQDSKIVAELEQARQKFSVIHTQIVTSNKAISATEELIELFKKTDNIIDSFDEGLFDRTVEKLIYYKRSTVGFVLHNGLEIKINLFKEER